MSHVTFLTLMPLTRPLALARENLGATHWLRKRAARGRQNFTTPVRLYSDKSQKKRYCGTEYPITTLPCFRTFKPGLMLITTSVGHWQFHSKHLRTTSHKRRIQRTTTARSKSKLYLGCYSCTCPCLLFSRCVYHFTF